MYRRGRDVARKLIDKRTADTLEASSDRYRYLIVDSDCTSVLRDIDEVEDYR
jgi:hypothetical protein